MLLINIKQQDDSTAYLRDLLNVPKRISGSTCRLIASACKIKCFEYENKERRESNSHTERLNLNKNPDMSQQP